METWDIQQYHLETHNLFYSALFGEIETGLVDIGYRVVGEFTVLEDPRSDTIIEPCYTVFDGDSLVFFDILEPGNITEEELARVASYNEVGLEAVENHLSDVEVSDEYFDHNDINTFEHCVICREEQVTQQKNGDGEKRRRWERLARESTIATVEAGGALTVASGSLRAGNLNDLLNEGVVVPERVSHTIYLPRRIQDESLAIAICEEIVLGSDLRDGGIELKHGDIRNHFGRSISYDQLDDVFEYLRDIGACRQHNGHFVFTKYDLSKIMDARAKLKRMNIQAHLADVDDERDQRSLDEY